MARIYPRGPMRTPLPTAVGLAVERLVAEGFVRVERDGQTHRHYSERPFEDTAEGSG